MKIFAIIVALILTSFGIYFYSNQFKPSNISLGRPSIQTKRSEMPSEIKSLWDSPFSYLGEGNQAYAFVSSDGNYVVKFFKNTPLNSNSWLDPFSSIPFIKTHLHKHRQRAQRKFDRVFNAYEVAYAHDQHNCGLVYIHLHQSQNLKILLQVIDAFGISHSLNLDNYAFVIQKKAQSLKNLLKEEIKKGNIDVVKLQLQQVIEMYIGEYQKGIFDHDHNLMANIGFVNASPMRIDLGKLVLDSAYTSKEIYLKDLDKIIHHRISKWFNRYFPEHSKEISQSLSPYLENGHVYH